MLDFKTRREETIKRLKTENEKLILQEIKELKSEGDKPKESKWIRVLRKYGGLESNIPIWSRYWKIRP